MKLGVEALAKLPGVWRGGELDSGPRTVVATGHAALDRELPGGGWPLGSLSEVLHDAVGIGEITLLAGALARACGNERLVAWVHPPHLPYAPALAQAGVPLEHCLVLRPHSREDALWAAEQALRSGACGAVLFWLPEARGAADEYACLRRLQIAAEAGRAMAVFFRPGAAERLSTPAHLRVALEPAANGLKIRIPKRRGPPLVTPIVLALGSRPTHPEAPPQPEQQRSSPVPVVERSPVHA